MINTFINPQFQSLLERYQLNSFSALWDVKVNWFEEPNVRRGGWSGVGQLRLNEENGNEVLMYVKKQEDHGRRTWRHPIKGEPTFKREFNNLQFLDQHAFTAPRVVYYGQEETSDHQRAVLATLALDQHQSLEEWVHPNYEQLNEIEKTQFLLMLAEKIRQLHSLGMVHRALYPKHIFINPKLASNVAVIDLEKARLTTLGWYRTFFDLAALFRHSNWSKDEQLIFFKAYCGKSQLSHSEQWLFEKIQLRASR
ncbi:MAG TPA: lipopolysaccharide kinase InaA family protein [Methylotenera sp.]|nr:lipopolysaccharide kinase InaA family protein [Methylotenera sp.]